MYCRHCGKEINNNSKFCTSCGEKARNADTNKSSEIIDDGVGEQTQSKNNIGKWSWGAFGLNWLYLNYMKDKDWWIYLIIIIITNSMMKSSETTYNFIGFFGQLGAMAYLGTAGRKIAWQKRKWDSPEQFLKTQKAWDIWGILFTIVMLIYFIFMVLLYAGAFN